jgi:hypothetical protein
VDEVAPANLEFTKWWSANESGAFIHVDNESSGFSSPFWDGHDTGHHVEDVADDADSGTVIHSSMWTTSRAASPHHYGIITTTTT